MSDHLHHGLHPDTDSLNAFVEGAMPEHERLQCLAHLADCPRCREVVFLAQEPAPVAPVERPVRTWRRWFAPIPVFAAAGLFCLAMLAVWLYIPHTPGTPPPPIVARTEVAPPSPTLPPAEHQIPAPVPVKPLQIRKPASIARVYEPPPVSIIPPPVPPILMPPPAVTIQRAEASLPPSLQGEAPVPPKFSGLSAISGTVTDASGAIIPNATVKLRRLDGDLTANTRTDDSGQFQVSGLPVGKYELQIDSLGFRRFLTQVDLRSSEVASVKSQLQVGSVTETVEITAGASTIQTSTASISSSRTSKREPKGPRPIPGGLPAEVTLSRDKTVLAVNANGAVYVSRNSGRSWKSVKKVWSGKAELLSVTDTSFQLTTDAGAVWQSRDGSHWSPALPQQ